MKSPSINCFNSFFFSECGRHVEFNLKRLFLTGHKKENLKFHSRFPVVLVVLVASWILLHFQCVCAFRLSPFSSQDVVMNRP